MQTRKSVRILKSIWLELIILIAAGSILISDCYHDQKKHNLGVELCKPYQLVELSQNNGYVVCQLNNGKKILKELR